MRMSTRSGAARILVILEADDGDSGGEQKAITLDIALWSRKVSSPIGLNDQACLFAEKVDDERPERLLPPEFRTIDLTVAQQLPELLLSRRRRSAQSTCAEALWAEQVCSCFFIG